MRRLRAGLVTPTSGGAGDRPEALRPPATGSLICRLRPEIKSAPPDAEKRRDGALRGEHSRTMLRGEHSRTMECGAVRRRLKGSASWRSIPLGLCAGRDYRKARAHSRREKASPRVIPGAPKGANPESILRSVQSLAQGLWIPGLRFAHPGMTGRGGCASHKVLKSRPRKHPTTRTKSCTASLAFSSTARGRRTAAPTRARTSSTRRPRSRWRTCRTPAMADLDEALEVGQEGLCGVARDLGLRPLQDHAQGRRPDARAA